MSYESEILRDWYLLFHYGSRNEIVEGVAFDSAMFPPECFEFPVQTVAVGGIAPSVKRALDIGCAVGRSSYELSKVAEEVIGIDFSESFVRVAAEVGSGEPVSYRRYGEMHLASDLEALLPPGANADRVSFEQGDAMDLRADLGKFDVVHAANLLCRLPEPQRFLDRLPDLLVPGGILIMATPATWLTDYTPRENFPPEATLNFLKSHLSETFDLQSVQEIPFLIREHQRKLQLSTAQTSVWVRKLQN